MARLKAGEDVVGLDTRPMTRKDAIAVLGWTPGQVRHAERLSQLHEIGAEREFFDEVRVRSDRVERAASHTVLRRQRQKTNP